MMMLCKNGIILIKLKNIYRRLYKDDNYFDEWLKLIKR